MNFIFLLLITLVALAYIRHVYIKSIELKTKYALYELRDKLRMLAAEGKVNPNAIGFDFLDGAISQSIIELYHITLFRTVFLNLTNSVDDMKAKKNFLENEISTNFHFQDILTEFNKVMLEYIFYQHMFSRFLFAPILKFFKVGRGFMRWCIIRISVLNANVAYMNNGVRANAGATV